MSAADSNLPALNTCWAGGQILAGLAPILPASMTAADTYRVRLTLDLLLHDDRVCAFRHHSTGHDLHGLSRLDRFKPGPTGP